MPLSQANERDIDFSTLGAVPMFSHFPAPDLHTICRAAVRREYGQGENLFKVGDLKDELIVLLSGEIELSTVINGQSCVVAICQGSALVNDASFFSTDPSKLQATALTRSKVIAISGKELLSLIERRLDLQRPLLSAMSQKLHNMVKKIAELKLKTTAQRLGIYLLSLTDEEAGQAVLILPQDKKRIAEQLGMKPESLSRSLAKLAKAGVESLPNNKITISDVSTLREFCITDD